MNLDEIKYAVQGLRKRKTRSWLTVLSILIGITAIFSLVSFGIGISRYVDRLADEAGRDKLFIQAKGIGAPGIDKNFFITKEEIDFVGKIKGVKDIAGWYLRAGEITFKNEKRFNFVIGLDPAKIDFIDEAFTVTVSKGRRLKKHDFDKVVLGYNYQFDDKIFKKRVKLGDRIKINGRPYRVIGFYEEVGNPTDDANIYLTLEAMELLYDGIKDKFGAVVIRAEKGIEPSKLAEKIEEKLRKFKGQEEGKEDFFVQSFEDALATFSTILNVINSILVLIALISLIVASVNIMNTMYTAVLERTNEIGVMKAIGAQNKDILLIFMFEAGLLGFVGGLIGVVAGFLVASTGGAIAAAAGFSSLQPYFPWWLWTGSVLFSFLVGVASGFLPALQASRLQAVDALRYE
jgi:putative ABC transport system permease protein